MCISTRHYSLGWFYKGPAPRQKNILLDMNTYLQLGLLKKQTVHWWCNSGWSAIHCRWLERWYFVSGGVAVKEDDLLLESLLSRDTSASWVGGMHGFGDRAAPRSLGPWCGMVMVSSGRESDARIGLSAWLATGITRRLAETASATIVSWMSWTICGVQATCGASTLGAVRIPMNWNQGIYPTPLHASRVAPPVPSQKGEVVEGAILNHVCRKRCAPTICW